MHGFEYHIDQSDIRTSTLCECSVPADLAPGEILLAVEKFALTANNITYAATGGIIGYWQFFPAPKPWGIVPVWGFARVIASNAPEIAIGERVYGFLPFASHLVMRPDRIKPASMVDGAAHRAALPPIYNDYQRLGTKAPASPLAEDIQMLFQPLFATSFLLHDFFTQNDCFGASTIILGSASSKTAMGVARLFAQDKNITIIGLTSADNKDFVHGLGDYDQVISYEDISALPADTPSAYIDMSGNAAVKRALHTHLGDNMRYSCAVGISHWDKFEEPGPMPGAKPAFFFAPDQALKRRKDWGGMELQNRISTQLQAWAKDGMNWLSIKNYSTANEAAALFADLRDGNVDPKVGHVVTLMETTS